MIRNIVYTALMLLVVPIAVVMLAAIMCCFAVAWVMQQVAVIMRDTALMLLSAAEYAAYGETTYSEELNARIK